VLLRTSYDGAAEIREIWRSLLRGGRGVVFWDPGRKIVGEDGRAGDRGRRLAPHLREIKGGLGALLIRSRRQVAPVAVLYSPASMRTQWMLDWQPKGTAWSDRAPGAVYEDANAVRSSMTAFLDFLGRVGLEARVLTPELLEHGELRRGVRVLILPRALALSAGEAAEIRRFAAAGGTLLADAIPGSYDEHSRRRAAPQLADLFGARPAGRGGAVLLEAPSRGGGGELMSILARAGVEAMFTLTRKDGSRAMNIETQLWRDGRRTILALQREAGEAAEPVRLTLKAPALVDDLRAGKSLGTATSLELTIDTVVPTLLSIAAAPAAGR